MPIGRSGDLRRHIPVRATRPSILLRIDYRIPNRNRSRSQRRTRSRSVAFPKKWKASGRSHKHGDRSMVCHRENRTVKIEALLRSSPILHHNLNFNHSNLLFCTKKTRKKTRICCILRVILRKRPSIQTQLKTVRAIATPPRPHQARRRNSCRPRMFFAA